MLRKVIITIERLKAISARRNIIVIKRRVIAGMLHIILKKPRDINEMQHIILSVAIWTRQRLRRVMRRMLWSVMKCG